jgi:hypothetical protein
MKFFENPEHMAKFRSVIDSKSRISLQIIDWFVTNYAKKYDTEYIVKMRTGILKDLVEDFVFKVYHRYKLQCKAYTKKRFDSFCRWERIWIPDEHGELIETTVGQLNFFKWSIENNVLEYIDEHFDEIREDKNLRNSAASRKADTAAASSQRTRKKRQELTVVASKCIKRENVRITVKFDN